MQTKFYFLLAALVGFTSVSSKLVAQTACFSYGSQPAGHAGFQLSVEEFASFDGTESAPSVAALAGKTTYRIYLETPSSGDQVTAVRVNGTSGSGSVQLSTTTSFYNDPYGGLTVNLINPALFSFFPSLAYDSYVTIGLSSKAVPGQQSVQLSNDAAWGPSFNSGGNLNIPAASNGGWFVTGGSNSFAGVNQRVLLAQVTTDGELSGDLNVNITPQGGAAFSHTFSFDSAVCGCTDPTSPNYVPTANLNDGSCIYLGCTDASACNFDGGANTDDGSCNYCCNASTSSLAGYGIEVELYANGGIPGLRTYRVYATMDHPTDALSAVAGTSEFPLLCSTTTHFYQHPSGGNTPNNLNPLFFGIAPALAYDSYVTIGLTSAPVTGELSVQTAETPGFPWLAPFAAGNDIEINSVTGGAWFVQPGSTNAIAGADLRVLVAQFTTDGFISGSMLLSVFEQGNQGNEVRPYVTFETPLCACTDETACNYSAEALWEDGSCQYPEDLYGASNVDCAGECLNDADGDGVCNEDEISGCLNPLACNFVAGATNLVTCQYPAAGYDCAGACLVDTDGDGVCDPFEVVDCTDPAACNYNSNSTTNSDNTLCNYPPTHYNCAGACVSDVDGDGVCDGLELEGCTDNGACNYDTSATDDDGSCEYCCQLGTSVGGYSVSVENVGTSPEGTVYRMYISTANAADQLSAITGQGATPTEIRSTQPFFQSAFVGSSPFPNNISPVFFGIAPDMAYDSWVTIGNDQMITDPSMSNPSAVTSTNWIDVFNAGGDIVLNSYYGDGWYVTPNYTNGIAGADKKVLVGQFTTEGVLSGVLYAQIFVNGDQSNNLLVSLPFGYASNDTEGPAFTFVPSDVTQSCGTSLPTAVATAVDGGCVPAATVTFEDEVVDLACGSQVIRTFTATDAFGNTSTAQQTITLTDNVPPVLVLPADATVQCGDDLTPGAGVLTEPTSSTDNCSGPLTFEYSDASYSPSVSMNGATADFRLEMGLNVAPTSPFRFPRIMQANNVSIGAGNELTLANTISNQSNHRGGLIVDVNGGQINLTVTGTLGGYNYHYARLVISNIEGFTPADLNVVTNNIAPGATVTTEVEGDVIRINYEGISTYTDNTTGVFALENQSTCLASSGIARTWTVTDGCGLSATGVQYITIVDTEGPEFVDFPADATISCDDAQVFPMVSATDCSGTANVTLATSTVAGTCANNYQIHRTFTAVDGCNNTSVRTQVITVVDDEAPAFTYVPADLIWPSANYTGSSDMATASDNCGAATVTVSETIDASAGTSTTVTRVFMATDICGNQSTATQIITVNEVLGCMQAGACNYNPNASYDDGSCDFCSCGNAAGGVDGFGLELELFAENSIGGQNTYRVYVTTPSTADFVSAVAGDSNVPAFLRTTTSFYQHPFGSYTAAQINPLFFGFVPTLQYDSWLTMGISNSPGAGESDVTFVLASGDNWINSFEAGGNLEINSFFGGSWFTLPTFSNGYAGADQRVLVAQLTTDGQLSGQLYVQVFPNGVGADARYLTLTFGASGCGCLDEAACTYDEDAQYNDPSACVYPVNLYGSEFVDCDGNCLSDVDGDGICDQEEIAGCTDASACNYNEDATDENGTCSFPEVCSGCTDTAACNFNANASNEDGSCTYPEFGFDCDGNCLDQNGDLICDAEQGCDNPTACNYDPTVANPDDFFCDFCSCANISSSNANYGLSIEPQASSIPGMTTYKLYVTTPSATDKLNAILGNAENPIVLATTTQFWQDPLGSALVSSPALLGVWPTANFDSYLALGENTPASSVLFPGLPGQGNPAWVGDFENGESIVIDDAVGSGWYMSAMSPAAYGVAGEDHKILFAQLTTNGTLSGELYMQIFPNGLAAGNTVYVSMSFGNSACGCTDEAACNYSEGAIDDDGQCYFSAESCEDVCLFDNEIPVVQSVENYTTSCLNAATDIRQPNVTDNCDDALEFSYEDVVTAGACAGSWTITRTWTVNDNIGFYVTAVQQITVQDDEAPTFVAPADITLACGANLSDLSLTGEATDLADGCGTATVTYSDAEGDAICFSGDVIIRTWTATDACGNSTSLNQTITLVDEVAPYFTSVPEDVMLACGDALPTTLAVAGDACSDVSVTVSLEYQEANCTGMQSVVRHFTATDACGNTAQASQTITYVDMVAPTFDAPADASVSCTGSAAPEFTGVPSNVADNCSGSLSVSHVDAFDTSADGCFANDVIRRTWTVTDACGNSTSATQMIQLVDDNAPVMAAVEASVSLSCGEALPTGVPSASDDCSSVTVTYSDAAGEVGCTGLANIIRTFTATDACGNTSTQTQTFVFVDDVAPVFTAPADVTVECTSDLEDLSSLGDVTDATDNCASDLEVTYQDAYSTSADGCFNDDIITRTWTVTDGCGNSASATQVITLVDHTAPVVEVNPEVELIYYQDQDLPAVVELTAEDACSGVIITHTDSYAAAGVSGFELTRVYHITDACGNETTISQHIIATYYRGCTYPDAINYDALAVSDDGSCLYEGCIDPLAANFNPIASVSDGSCVIVGCMDPAGLDYNAAATYPGGCDYPDPCPGDLDGDGEVSVSDLLDFFQYYGTICE
jgi:hypothetical protein